jgi:hypothetical protein
MSASGNSKHSALIVIFTILGCLFIVFFGLRAFHAFKKFNRHPLPSPAAGQIETDVERIRDWMTIPFISRMYGVSEEIIFDALGIPPQGSRNKSLEDLNEEFFPQADGHVMQIVKTTVLAHQPPPTPAPLLTPVPPSP